jgi:hypothetical protein
MYDQNSGLSLGLCKQCCCHLSCSIGQCVGRWVCSSCLLVTCACYVWHLGAVAILYAEISCYLVWLPCGCRELLRWGVLSNNNNNQSL